MRIVIGCAYSRAMDTAFRLSIRDRVIHNGRPAIVARFPMNGPAREVGINYTDDAAIRPRSTYAPIGDITPATYTLTVAHDNGSAVWVRNSLDGITNGRFTIYRDTDETMRANGDQLRRYPWSLWDSGSGVAVHYGLNFRTVADAKALVTDAVGVLATKLPA